MHRLALVASCLAAASCACAAAQDESPGAEPVARAAPDPMASFARFLPGAWGMTLTSGTTSLTEWHWGPGKHSIRAGELELYYWHPGRKEVCMLSMHADIPGVGRGVGEGTIRFEGETAEGVFDLYQPRGHRKMGERWVFDGPDQYTDTLLEATGLEGLKPLAQWAFFRKEARPPTAPTAAEGTAKPAEPVKALEPFLGGVWRSQGDSGTTLSTFEAIPDYVYARVVAPKENGEPTHVLDAYFYQHVGTGALRCLALSERGGVYEGDITVVEGGALQLDLQGYEGDRVVPYVVRIDFEQDATLRQRVWTLEGTDRRSLLDVRHRKLDPALRQAQTAPQIAEYVVEAFEDRKGNLWFGTMNRGVARYDGKTLTYLTEKDGLCGGTVVSIAEDPEGNLWFGTHTGLCKYDPSPSLGPGERRFTRYLEAESRVLASRDGTIWAGSGTDVLRFDGNAFTAFDLPVPRADIESYSIVAGRAWPSLEDSRGNLWFATDGYGAFRFDGTSFEHFTKEDGLCSDTVWSILEDAQGGIWFACIQSFQPATSGDGGVCRYDGSTFTKFPEVEGLSRNDIYPLYKTKSGDLWIGATGRGAYRYDGKRFTLFDRTDRPDLTTNFGVQGIVEDRNGTLWFGFSGGLFRFDGSSFVNVTQEGPWTAGGRTPR